MDTTIFAKRLKELRLESGLTQLEASKRFGISNTALSQYESGKRTPGVSVLSALACAYHVPLSYFLHGETEAAAALSEEEIRHLMCLKGRYPALLEQLCALDGAEDEMLSALSCLLDRIIEKS